MKISVFGKVIELSQSDLRTVKDPFSEVSALVYTDPEGKDHIFQLCVPSCTGSISGKACAKFVPSEKGYTLCSIIKEVITPKADGHVVKPAAGGAVVSSLAAGGSGAVASSLAAVGGGGGASTSSFMHHAAMQYLPQQYFQQYMPPLQYWQQQFQRPHMPMHFHAGGTPLSTVSAPAPIAAFAGHGGAGGSATTPPTEARHVHVHVTATPPPAHAPPPPTAARHEGAIITAPPGSVEHRPVYISTEDVGELPSIASMGAETLDSSISVAIVPFGKTLYDLGWKFIPVDTAVLYLPAAGSSVYRIFVNETEAGYKLSRVCNQTSHMQHCDGAHLKWIIIKTGERVLAFVPTCHYELNKFYKDGKCTMKTTSTGCWSIHKPEEEAPASSADHSHSHAAVSATHAVVKLPASNVFAAAAAANI